jgi:hypothetical protein
LALAFAAAPDWTIDSLAESGAAALLVSPRWMPRLAGKVRQHFPQRCHALDIEEFLCDSDTLYLVLEKEPRPWPSIRRWVLPEPSMLAVSGPPGHFALPQIATTADLATWLGLSAGDLAWFSDLRGQNARTDNEALRHYVCRIVPKRTGGHRLLEQPKARLKAIQRTIATQLLSAIPVSPKAHGFVQGRSIHSFVRPHVGKRVVVRIDLASFFSTIGNAQVRAIFRRVGYPGAVAAQLAGLCTTLAPACVLEELAGRNHGTFCFDDRQRLRAKHLPQGAPTSPALSNLATFAADRRLTALAAKFNATYTRYADDLAFSGDAAFAKQVHGFVPHAAAVLMEENFHVRFAKTRIMFSGKRQHLTGLVINQKTNVVRRDYDTLRAILHQASHTGLAAQNREGRDNFRAHLQGRIAYVAATNPARGARLAKLFARIPDQT